jgi:heat shock protein HspQ
MGSSGRLRLAQIPRKSALTSRSVRTDSPGFGAGVALYRIKRFPPLMLKPRAAKFKIGQVVRHRLYPFRGVIFDVDPTFNNTEEWWLSIPAEVRPDKDQPFYHLFAENAESEYIAYVSEQNLLPDTSGAPIRHPQVSEVFERDDSGSFRPRNSQLN